MKLFEYVTGVPRTFAFVGSYRHIPTTRAHFQSCAADVAPHGRDLPPLPNFDLPQSGVSAFLETKPGVVAVYSKVHKTAIEIPMDDRPRYKNGQLIGINDLVIQDNYFLAAAVV